MDRRRFLVTSMAGAIAMPFNAGAQPHRLGILGDKASDSSEIHFLQILRAGLQEHGWNEGGNLLIDYRWIEGNVAQLPGLAAELVRLKPDAITTRGSLFTAAFESRDVLDSIVFVGHADPVGTGHVASLARPGGNITGTAVLQTDLGPKGLQLLHDVLPAAGRIALLWHQGAPSAVPGLKALDEPARIPPAATAASQCANLERPGQRLRECGPRRRTGHARIQHASVHHRPTAARPAGHGTPAPDHVPEPALRRGRRSDELLPKPEDYWRRGAVFVDKIFRGARPADLPVEQATTLEFIINRRTADAIGLTIPPSLLARADQVIE